MPPNIGSTSTPLGTVLASESQWEPCITPSPGASFAPARSIATVTASSPALLVSVVERFKCITSTLSQMAAPELPAEDGVVTVCTRHHRMLHGFLNRQKQWKKCPHQHRTREARRQCEMRLNQAA